MRRLEDKVGAVFAAKRGVSTEALLALFAELEGGYVAFEAALGAEALTERLSARS